MAVRKIIKVGDETLRKKSKPVTSFNENLWQLLDDMKETMRVNKGMGLAAVQVGVLKRIVVIDVNGLFAELVNPIITKHSGSDIEEEGCLSVGPQRDFVKRPMKITVKAQDRYGYDIELTGEKYFARCVCHELDHLDGILYIDKIEKGKK